MKVVLLGEGAIARRHVAALRRIEDVEIASVVGGDAAGTVDFARESGIAHHALDLAEALALPGLDAAIEGRSTVGLDAYSDRALSRVWKAVRFSWWMTTLLHRFPGDDEMAYRLQEAELDYLAGSEARSSPSPRTTSASRISSSFSPGRSAWR
jgi:2-polyprenyl-6-methoxyphenol hydroxylase-like FAD-dependent oxidoreductase